MDFSCLFRKDTPAQAKGLTPEEIRKKLADDTQALAGLEELVQKINASNSSGGQPPGLSQEEYLARLRKEGSGL